MSAIFEALVYRVSGGSANGLLDSPLSLSSESVSDDCCFSCVQLTHDDFARARKTQNNSDGVGGGAELRKKKKEERK